MVVGCSTLVGAQSDNIARHGALYAGWPEGAVAGALGIRLSGPRIYADRVADEPWLNGNAPDPDGATVFDALALFRRMVALLALALAALALV